MLGKILPKNAQVNRRHNILMYGLTLRCDLRAMELGNCCSVLQTNPNLSKFTSIHSSSKPLLIIFCRLIFQKCYSLFVQNRRKTWVT